METVVPSFIAKVARAKRHLVDLEAEIERWINTKPYTVRESVEGKNQTKVWRLTFTSDPANTGIPILAADAIYNLRSSLDHLMSSLVTKKDRGSAMFPVFFEGVWEPDVAGENSERLKQRSRWRSDTKTLGPDAVALLKVAQPPDRSEDGDEANYLRVLNSLSNRDRHTKLPIVAHGLGNFILRWKRPDGTPQHALGLTVDKGGFFKNDARISNIPQDAVEVEIAGTPEVAIRVGLDGSGRERFLVIPKLLIDTTRLIETNVIPPLMPHVRA
jgi:hypothetical protein